jgi:hypothetical protein
LPGGQHAFDLFHSLRFEAVVNAIDAFTAQVLSCGSPERPRWRPGPPARQSG